MIVGFIGYLVAGFPGALVAALATFSGEGRPSPEWCAELAAALCDRHPAVRREAAGVVERLGNWGLTSEALGNLLELAHSPTAADRSAAVRALTRLMRDGCRVFAVPGGGGVRIINVSELTAW